MSLSCDILCMVFGHLAELFICFATGDIGRSSMQAQHEVLTWSAWGNMWLCSSWCSRCCKDGKWRNLRCAMRTTASQKSRNSNWMVGSCRLGVLPPTASDTSRVASCCRSVTSCEGGAQACSSTTVIVFHQKSFPAHNDLGPSTVFPQSFVLKVATRYEER